jgi:oligopeptidase A
MRSLLELRGKQAHLLGSFDNYAELSIASKMAPDVTAVETLLERLHARAIVSATEELENVREFAAKEGHSPIHAWDTPYYSEKLKEERFGVSDEVLRDYFPFSKVLDGMFATAERLYNIKVSQVQTPGALLEPWQWDPNVRLYQVRDGETDEHIADFFLDPYSRPQEKRGGAWMDVAVTPSKDTTSNAKRAVAILVCNQQPPVSSAAEAETYMTWEEVLTLWHEFGHGLNLVLTTSPYDSVAGIHGVEWDAVELPSQFMENWCYHRGTLNGMTSHRVTGEQLPDDLFEKLIAARKHMSGWQLLRQVQLAEFDMELHKKVARIGAGSSDGGNNDALDVTARQVRDKYQLLLSMWPDDTLYTHFLHSFMHIFGGGYAAGYYSYLWAEVLSADAFGAFEEVGLDDDKAVREVGMKMRRTIMASGGSRHPMELFKEFRGREPMPDALFRHRGLE